MSTTSTIPATIPVTIPAALRRASSTAGHALAVADAERRLTWRELHQEVQLTARALVALGLGRGDRLALWAPNSWQWVVCSLATTYVGATLVPLNSRYTGHEVVDVVRRTRARIVVLADGFLGRDQLGELRSAAATDLEDDGSEGARALAGCPETVAVVTIGSQQPGAVSFSAIAEVAAPVDPERVETMADAVGADDVADILFTSGTTGRSKGACSAHRQTLAAAEAWATEGRVSGTDRYFVINPMFHAFGYKAGLLTCVLRTAAIVTRPLFDLDEATGLLRDEGISVIAAAPPVFQDLLDSPDRPAHARLRLAVTGATLVPTVLIERIQQELDCPLVLTAYGLTEAVVATMCRAGDAPDVIARTVGRAVCGFEVRIAGTAGAGTTGAGGAATGVTGEVLLRGPNVMLGYLDDPEATAAAIDEDGWFHTGDVGSLDDTGYLTITDRLKDVVIVGGFNVYPAEIEQVLSRLPGVREVAAVGAPDPRLGEVVRALVVRQPGSALAAADVTTYCRERLANFKVPRAIEFVDALPRNAAGKVLRRSLRS
ncbi:AMP-binding protein [Nocardioides sambongensis]|uniref:AMP-binding protein n=1 Tax=Nocardioides sambongensis TaxID=2589074 RepID=UPI001129AFBD|nr:AMP-binding protein [Nocardioides sambongensis]